MFYQIQSCILLVQPWSCTRLIAAYLVLCSKSKGIGGGGSHILNRKAQKSLSETEARKGQDPLCTNDVPQSNISYGICLKHTHTNWSLAANKISKAFARSHLKKMSCHNGISRMSWSIKGIIVKQQFSMTWMGMALGIYTSRIRYLADGSQETTKVFSVFSSVFSRLTLQLPSNTLEHYC